MSDRLNAYICQSCPRRMVTVDLEEGVTPMMLSCDKCGGRAMSMFYRAPAESSSEYYAWQPEYAWKKPTPAEIKQYRPEVREAMRDHVERGGLALYRIGADINDLTLITN